MILISSSNVISRGVPEHLKSLQFTETMFTHTMILLLWKLLKLPASIQGNTAIPQLVSQFTKLWFSSQSPIFSFIAGDDQSCDGEGATTTCTTNSQPIISEYMLKNAAAKWILKTREGHRIPQSVMESIVSGASSLFQLALSGFQQTLETRLLETNVSTDVSALVMECFNHETQYTRVFQGLESSYRQNAYIRANFPFVVRNLRTVVLAV